ncbi:ABC transporter permease [Nocardioides sp. Arc9.136]|uniref:ABC transporter permease n=1 Tax=Nocardioides sp. Arc9.136 TaxID=2996826 RepID=UPI002665F3EB|nr:ABC transporter permease [Nocardioides sp. Arc9.136]WKN48928.1 ABC transporter permease [Nocardioides sp. Arc9.136]
MSTRPVAARWRQLAGLVARRLGVTLVLLVGVTIVTFSLVQLVPGDAASANLSEAAQADPEVVAAYRDKWGLDDSIVERYLTYMGNLLHGDLSVSQVDGRSVATSLGDYVPATLELAIPAMLIAVVLGVSIGMLGAVKRGRVTDQVIRFGALVGLSTPSFWLAIVVLYVFFFVLGIAPNGGRLSPQFAPPPEVTGMYTVDAALAGQWTVWWDAVQHLMLPVLVLSCLTVAMLIRFVRSSMLEVMQQDYVAAATAKGLPRRTVLGRHVLRAGLAPVLTVSGLAFASMLSGTVLIEQVFSWPGLGQYAYRSASSLDLPSIMGVCLLVALIYMLMNLVVDFLYGVIDPRIRG